MRVSPRRWVIGSALLAVAVSLCACGRQVESADPKYTTEAPPGPPIYRLAVHPLHNPNKLHDAYGPLVEHLNRHIADARFELEASRDYAAFEAKFHDRGPHLLLPNPWQSLRAMASGYHVIAMAGDADDFKGIFLVLRDSPVRTPADLKGKAVAYPAPTALAAAMMPQWFLHEQGLDVMREIENRYVGSQESSIQNALSGAVAAAATWPTPWRAFQKEHPQEAARLRVAWQTRPLLNNSVMARDDLPAAVRGQVRALLLGLHETPQGVAMLEGMAIARFHAADDASYAPVREFVARFEREVRPAEQR